MLWCFSEYSPNFLIYSGLLYISKRRREAKATVTKTTKAATTAYIFICTLSCPTYLLLKKKEMILEIGIADAWNSYKAWQSRAVNQQTKLSCY